MYDVGPPQTGAPKKPWELRYVLLTNTTLRWTQPIALYLLERIGSSGKVWLVGGGWAP